MPLPGGESDTTICLVGRELCLFITLDAGKLPARQRKAYAALSIKRASPFPDPDFDIAWNPDGTACAWYWSRSRVTTLASAEPGRRKRFMAEALHVGQPLEHDSQLLRLAAGVEGRIWKSGRLVASRWWEETPAPEPWQQFLRGAGGAPTGIATVPDPIPAAPVRTSWGQQPSGSSALKLGGLDQYLPRVAFALTLLLLLATGFELGSIARAQLDILRAKSETSRLDAPLKRILDARDAADKASAEITGLLSLHGTRPTTSLMAELTRLVPGSEWQLKQWNQTTPETLEVSLIAPGSNPEQLVTAWENSPMFEGVTTELGRDNELVIKATITPASSPSGEATP